MSLPSVASSVMGKWKNTASLRQEGGSNSTKNTELDNDGPNSTAEKNDGIGEKLAPEN